MAMGIGVNLAIFCGPKSLQGNRQAVESVSFPCPKPLQKDRGDSPLWPKTEEQIHFKLWPNLSPDIVVHWVLDSRVEEILGKNCNFIFVRGNGEV